MNYISFRTIVLFLCKAIILEKFIQNSDLFSENSAAFIKKLKIDYKDFCNKSGCQSDTFLIKIELKMCHKVASLNLIITLSHFSNPLAITTLHQC